MAEKRAEEERLEAEEAEKRKVNATPKYTILYFVRIISVIIIITIFHSRLSYNIFSF
jgi:hypothetical protein